MQFYCDICDIATKCTTSLLSNLKAAKETYRDKEDTIGQFIAECCIVSEDTKECLLRGRKSQTFVSSSELYDAYKEWHSENSPRKPMSNTAFGKRMKKRFFQRRGRENGKRDRYYYGIKLIKDKNKI